MRLLRLLFCLTLLTAALPVAAAETCCRCTVAGATDTTCLNVTNSSRGTTQKETCQNAPTTYKLDGWSCEWLDASQCARVGSGAGVCQRGPIGVHDLASEAAEGETIGTTAKPPTPAIIPNLNVPIPGFAFTGSEVTAESSSLLAEYLAGAYRYGISITAVAATIMFVYGAFQYLVGSAIPSVNNGKRIMQEAILGMLLVFGANLILRTVNPATLTLEALYIKGVLTESYANALAGNRYAAEFLGGLGLAASSGDIGPPSYTIPLNCPGRSKSGGGPYPKYALEAKSGPLTTETIQKYLAEQERTGIPAAVIMAQMFTESGSACPIVNLFKNPAVCGGQHSINYNFGGIGCTEKEVPADACAHLAFPTAFVNGSHGASYPMTVEQVNEVWNDDLPNCSELAKTSSRDTYTSCGNLCYPQKSHATVRIDGKEIWIQSVMCAKKFDGPQAFLDAHLYHVKACLPYNDSVYKFAYCVGASNYASAGEKAKELANIIEQNCLCDPEKDSMKCVRNRKLEDDIANEIIKKTNLFKLYSLGKLDGIAYDRIAEALWKSTGGRLTPGPSDIIAEEAAVQESTTP